MTLLPRTSLGKTGIDVSAIGFGSFKIGRNRGIKYPDGYELPGERACAELLEGILDLGINLIDTAPAYGMAEERIGRHLSQRREDFVLSSKVGEQFIDGESIYQFGAEAVAESVENSLRRLQTDHLDLLFIHSNGDDLHILNDTDTVVAMQLLKRAGKARAIGLSGKTIEGAEAALDWADVLMVEYHLNDDSHREVMEKARQRDVGVLVKKGLAAGHLPPENAIRYVLQNRAVNSLVLGGLNRNHFAENCRIATEVRGV